MTQTDDAGWWARNKEYILIPLILTLLLGLPGVIAGIILAILVKRRKQTRVSEAHAKVHA